MSEERLQKAEEAILSHGKRLTALTEDVGYIYKLVNKPSALSAAMSAVWAKIKPYIGTVVAVGFGCLLTVGIMRGCDGPVPPVPPVPPGPGPVPPKPPEPDPKPPIPIPKGYRVLFVHETGDDSTLPPGTIAAMYSHKVRSYLDAKCGKDNWRRWDDDQNPKNESEVWQKLWASVRPQIVALPCVVTVVDQKAEILPVPNNADALLSLLKKHLGD